MNDDRSTNGPPQQSLPVARGRARAAARLAAALLLGVVASCGDSGTVAPDGGAGGGARAAPPASGQRPLIVVGADGLEWELLLQFFAKGALPNLAALAQEGCAGELATLDITLSPIIWTTVVTGKLPGDHGIKGFTYRGGDDLPHLFLSMHRQSKALWNLYDEAGLATEVVGWWCTYPVEPIRGGMVAQTSTRAQADISDGGKLWKGSYLAGVQNQVWPEERAARMDAHAQQLFEAIEARRDPYVERFGPAPAPERKLPTQLWSVLRTAHYADLLFTAAALDVVDAPQRPDALLLYLGSVDVASHMFWRYFEPAAFDDRPNEADVARFGGMIETAYRFIDATVGELRRRAPEADFLLLSDHGFHAVARKEAFPDERVGRADSGNHQDAPPGVFLAAGPCWKKQPLKSGATRGDVAAIGRVEDVLPTLLVRAGLPYAKDGAGKPLLHVLSAEARAAHPLRSVATHDDPEWKRKRAELLQKIPAFERHFEAELRSVDGKNLELLKQLGYTDDGGFDLPTEPPRDAAGASPRDGDRK